MTAKSKLISQKVATKMFNNAKIAVAASKKIFPTAVLRNRARRRIYGAAKTAKVDTLPYFIVFMPNHEAIETPYALLVMAIETSCKELRKS